MLSSMNEIRITRHQSTVDVIGLTGDVARTRSSQEDGKGGNILGIVRAADRDRLDRVLQRLLDTDTLLFCADDPVALAERRHGHTGTDRIDVDVVRAELLCGRLGQCDDRPFARRVGRIRRPGVTPPRDRGDIDDTTAALLDHLLRRPLQAEEDAFRVHPMDAIPVLFRQVHDIRAPRNAGIVDDDIEATECRDRFRNHRVDLRHVADILFQGQAFHLILRRIVRRRLGRDHVDIGGNDLRAGFRHGNGDGLADTVARPRNQSDFVFQEHLEFLQFR